MRWCEKDMQNDYIVQRESRVRQERKHGAIRCAQAAWGRGFRAATAASLPFGSCTRLSAHMCVHAQTRARNRRCSTSAHTHSRARYSRRGHAYARALLRELMPSLCVLWKNKERPVKRASPE
eukprot:6213416-Pleurochrysis_carterae.AAC.2